ncbi:fungal specific transcription factor domain-containing protein [Phlyctema vagabunda]|uniref:Fungal specific transcription factor domain-containing protein n=1 Tax=Phlyctema vagabunda TaxID=108571 RepID=A0ABR4PDK2_9HELO
MLSRQSVCPELPHTASQSELSQSPSQSTNMEPSAKRRRISLACGHCRARKSRCDGVRPKCSACDASNLECVYAQSASGTNVIVGKEYLRGLEERLTVVEENLASLRGRRSTSQLDRSFDNTVSETIQQETTEHTKSNSDRNDVHVQDDDLQDIAVLGDDTDGMGAIQFSTEADCSFFGPSSNIAFTRQLFRAITRVSSNTHIWNLSGSGHTPGLFIESGIMSTSGPSSPLSHPGRHGLNTNARDISNMYTLPPEVECRRLVSQYFSETGMLFPYIHRETFMASYDEMKQNNFKRVRRTWLALLNIVMALATSTAIGTGVSCEKRIQDSEAYYQRAIGLFGMQMMRGTSIETVQYFLVLGQYLQGTQRSIETWAVHGLAVKAALQLGLHSANISKRLSPLEQEIRKRTWYGCIILDRTLSMTFGRPAAIPDNYIKMELPHHSDEWVYNNESEILASSSVSFFTATITLYQIMWSVIHLSYSDNIDYNGQDSIFDVVSQVFQTEQQLVRWQQTLPVFLQLYDPPSIPCDVTDVDHVTSSANKFRIILTLRHNNLRILLHRPVLVKFLKTAGELSSPASIQNLHLLQQIGCNSIQSCVQSALDTISIVKTIVTAPDSRRSWLGAWWFTLYYTFNATLVLLASILVVQDQKKRQGTITQLPMNILQLRNCVNDAVMAMQWLDSGNRMVDRCGGYIRQLSSVLDLMSCNENDFSNELDCAVQTVVGDTHSWNPGFPGDNTLHNSPLGIELGEFMLDGDIEFLNQLANMNKAMGEISDGNHGIL